MQFSKGYKLGLIIITLLLIVSCYPGRSGSLSDVISAEKKLDEAKKTGKLDKKVIDNTIEAYHFFITYFPYDTLVPSYIVREGQLYQMDGDYNKAISTLKTIKRHYPQAQEIPDAIFLTADIYEQNIKNQDSADFQYATILFDYTNSKVAAKTRTLLESRGISSDVFYKKYAGTFSKMEDHDKSDSTKRYIRYHAYWKTN